MLRRSLGNRQNVGGQASEQVDVTQEGCCVWTYMIKEAGELGAHRDDN